MKFERRDIDLGEITAILDRAGVGALSTEERDKLKAGLDTLEFLTNENGRGRSEGVRHYRHPHQQCRRDHVRSGR